MSERAMLGWTSCVSARTMSNWRNYTAACSGSLSAERSSLGIGMLTITEVPEPFDSIFISPWN